MAKAKDGKFSRRDMFKMAQGYGDFPKLSARRSPAGRPRTLGAGSQEEIKRILRS